MTPEQEERMRELCYRVQYEQDPAKFNELVEELNDLLDTRLEYLSQLNS